MKLTVRGPLRDNPRVLLSRLGYHAWPGRRGEEAYARRLGSRAYPRFHLYVHSRTAGTLSLNLHLDQKRPSYAGSHAHGADYDGAAVEAEAERIRRSIGR